MVEVDSHFKPLLQSILDIYKIVKHIEMLSEGIKVHDASHVIILQR